MSFGQQLKNLRKKHKITQVELATAIGLRRLAINEWESDKVTPSATSLKKLAEYFKTDTLALIETDQPKKIDKRTKAYNGLAVFNGLRQMIWGLKEGSADPVMKEALNELDDKIQQIIAERF